MPRGPEASWWRRKDEWRQAKSSWIKRLFFWEICWNQLKHRRETNSRKCGKYSKQYFRLENACLWNKMFLDHYKYQCLNSALFLRQGHRSVRTADPARQRQAAVMALFLTGMINDGAHTANGPGETRFYQTEKEGREREPDRGRHRGVRGGWTGSKALRVGSGSHCTCVFEQGTESLSAPVGCFCKHHWSLRRETTLTRIYPRGSIGDHSVINRGGVWGRTWGRRS